MPTISLYLDKETYAKFLKCEAESKKSMKDALDKFLKLKGG
tara:strand:- start:1358 stop:1480 length:123 start_codon:yes stop_codon:yes gene_type:complete